MQALAHADSSPHRPHGPSVKTEHLFLGLFLLMHAWIYVAFRGTVGWDVPPHMDMIDAWPWSATRWPVGSTFYSYHPPFIFALQRLCTMIGFTPIGSVHFTDMLATLVAFFFLRATIKRLGALHTWTGFVFLYVTTSLPMTVYLARSVNMDVFVLAQAAATLYFSVRLCTNSGPLDRTAAGGAVVALALSLLSKFSGILLLGIPPLIALVLADSRKQAMRLFLVGCAVSGLAVSMVSPYYVGRYYVQTGKLLVSNMDLPRYRSARLQSQYVLRDQDRIGFLRDYLFGNDPEAPGMDDRDQKHARMINTWKDFWAGNNRNLKQSSLSVALSTVYANLAVLFMAAGACVWAARHKRRTAFDRLGTAFILLAIVHVLFITTYGYVYPHTRGVTNKGIYIVPAIYGLGYLVALAATAIPFSKPTSRWYAPLKVTLMTMLAAYMVLNAALPVY